MRIIIVCDVPDWAIGHLAKSVEKYNQHHNIKMMYIHPRDAGDKKVQEKFLHEVKEFNPHLIDFEYFRTAGQLLEAYPELYQYKIVLMHHNMRDKALYMWNWQNNRDIDKSYLKIDKILCHCNKTKILLEDKGYAKNVGVIRYGFDHNFWAYSDKEPKEIAIGYAGRIVPWKCLKEIAEVAQELNYPVQIMGKVDKEDYWETVPKEPLRYDFTDCADKDRVDFYRNITIFVQNSIDGYEEGPMPMMEAMACGVPVITTSVGQASIEEGIFQNRVNCLIISPNNKESLKSAIQELMSNDKLRSELRKNAWDIVKNMTEEKMAREYSKIWNEVVYPDYPLVSVILSVTYDRIGSIKEIVKALSFQTYPNLEVIIAWDEEQKEDYGFNRRDYNLTIKEVWTNVNKDRQPYNLAMARNLAAIEAEGEFLIFNDSRLKPDENAVMMFVEALKNSSAFTVGGAKKVWFFGDKGGQKQSFVENFSAVKRSHFIQAGMFCERIDRYGGMTQEVRTRWSKQSGLFVYLGEAVAEEILKSSKSLDRRKDIVKTKLKIYKMYGDERC